MFVLMRCVAEAVVVKGVRHLIAMVPGGGFVWDVAADAAARYKSCRKPNDQHEDLRQVANATFEDARRVADQVVRTVAGHCPPEDQFALELYLSQFPGSARRSLRREEDPTGRTVPRTLSLNTPDTLARLLPPQMPSFRPGDPVPGRPDWTLVEPLGAGGFGEVWKAINPHVLEPLAVKFCTDPTSRQRLLVHEAKIIARVMQERRQAHIVRLEDTHLGSDTPWLAYEYVAGGDLGERVLAWQRQPVAERVKRAVEAMRVLAVTAGYFHGQNPPIVHRDLKPANILVHRPTPEKVVLKVTDFGIGGVAAAATISGSRGGMTAYTKALSMLAGAYTPIYASPQQQRGEPPDPRDDIHALGVIAYQMLTGRLDQGPGPKFERDLRTLGVPDALTQLIGDCVDPDPRHRPKTGTDLSQRLQVFVLSSEVAVEAVPVLMPAAGIPTLPKAAGMSGPQRPVGPPQSGRPRAQPVPPRGRKASRTDDRGGRPGVLARLVGAAFSTLALIGLLAQGAACVLGLYAIFRDGEKSKAQDIPFGVSVFALSVLVVVNLVNFWFQTASKRLAIAFLIPIVMFSIVALEIGLLDTGPRREEEWLVSVIVGGSMTLIYFVGTIWFARTSRRRGEDDE